MWEDKFFDGYVSFESADRTDEWLRQDNRDDKMTNLHFSNRFKNLRVPAQLCFEYFFRESSTTDVKLCQSLFLNCGPGA